MTISYTKSFRKDCKVLRKRSWDIEKLEELVKDLNATIKRTVIRN